MIDREDARGEISLLVRGGFETPSEIFESLIDSYLDPDDIEPADEEWLVDEIRRQFEDKRMSELSWPDETDWDRLERAFERISARGVLALHCAGLTQSDAISDAGQAYDDRGGRGSGLTGYVFYHRQDVDGVLASGELYLGFGRFEDGDVLAAPRLAVEELKAEGFSVEWAEDPGQRILIKGLVWRKSSPSD
jgi:hypothetical protein